jgi:hypothetical protein
VCGGKSAQQVDGVVGGSRSIASTFGELSVEDAGDHVELIADGGGSGWAKTVRIAAATISALPARTSSIEPIAAFSPMCASEMTSRPHVGRGPATRAGTRSLNAPLSLSPTSNPSTSRRPSALTPVPPHRIWGPRWPPRVSWSGLCHLPKWHLAGSIRALQAQQLDWRLPLTLNSACRVDVIMCPVRQKAATAPAVDRYLPAWRPERVAAAPGHRRLYGYRLIKRCSQINVGWRG